MLRLFESWRNEKSLKEKLLAFLAEMERNLETYYVMDQRQFITHGFEMLMWEQVKDLDVVKRHTALLAYGETLAEFNRAFNEHKDFERWYSSNMDHKTQENSKKLHMLKHDLDKRVKMLEPILIMAGQALEKELLNLGFISH